MVAKQEAEDKEAQAIKSTPWIEPESMQLLNDQYIIESKFAGRCPGTTMYLVKATKRDGTTDQIIDGQRFKLFIATSL